MCGTHQAAEKCQHSSPHPPSPTGQLSEEPEYWVCLTGWRAALAFQSGNGDSAPVSRADTISSAFQRFLSARRSNRMRRAEAGARIYGGGHFATPTLL